MKTLDDSDLPKARSEGLIEREVRGELLVYDLKRHKAFCLNETAARVWKRCDGKRSVNSLANELAQQRTSVNEKIIWLALDQLEKSNLLERKVPRPFNLAKLSRRNLIRAGLAGAIALPMVMAISSPTAQAAGSPINSTTCQGRHNSDPGGCGGNPCGDIPGTTCLQNGVSNACKCR